MLFGCLCSHTDLSNTPFLAYASASRRPLPVSLIYRTETQTPSAWMTRRDHKSKAPSSRATRRTRGCFSPIKWPINSVSQRVTLLRDSHNIAKKKTKKKQLTQPVSHSVLVLAAALMVDHSVYVQENLLARNCSTLQPWQHWAQRQLSSLIFPLLTLEEKKKKTHTNLTTSCPLNMALCIAHLPADIN